MYNSGIKTSDFIAQIKLEMDVSPTVPDSCFLRWINALEQLLYTEYIGAERWGVASVIDGEVDLTLIVPLEGEAALCADDVVAVFVDGEEISRTNVRFFYTLLEYDCSYIKKNNTTLALNMPNMPEEISVVYLARPALKEMVEGEFSDEPVALPLEFVDLAAAKLRGEAYRLADDDVQATRWLADYNVRLENFKKWIENRNSRFR